MFIPILLSPMNPISMGTHLPGKEVTKDLLLDMSVTGRKSLLILAGPDASGAGMLEVVSNRCALDSGHP